MSLLREPHYKETSNKTLTGEKGKLSTLRFLQGYLTPYKWSLIGAFLCLSLAAITVLALGFGIRYFVDHGMQSENLDLIHRSLGFFFIVILFMAAASYGRFYLVSTISEKVINDLRFDIFRHLLSLSSSYYELNKVEDLLSRITADSTLIQIIIGTSVSIALRNLLLLVGGLVLLFMTSSYLSLIVLALTPLILGIILGYGRKLRGLSKENQEEIGSLSAFFGENLHAIQTVQAFSHEDNTLRKFKAHLQKSYDTARKFIHARALMAAFVICTVFGAVIFILWVSSHMVLQHQLTIGQMSAFIFFAIIVATTAGSMSEIMADLQRAAGACDRLQDLLTTETEITKPLVPLTLPDKIQGKIEFSHVTFSYPSRPTSPALADVSFIIPPKTTAAIIGASGAGKTTLYQLLLRFYDPTQGEILIDGVPIKYVDPKETRKIFGVVAQSPVLFNTTVAENIAYADFHFSKEDVMEAAKMVQLHDFLLSLPEGYDTLIGERGVRLSGGQKQRIAIARALIKKPTILLLDEATNALDSESEFAIHGMLKSATQDMTTFIIAHRLSTIRNADTILVMDKGQLINQGTHEELKKHCTVYNRFVSLQARS